MYRIEKYHAEYFNLWNEFIAKSKNGTFLFHRDFMEYHSDRFDDFSLLVFDNEKLIAVMPANIVGNEVHSHQGLTYGGVVYGEKLKQISAINVLKALLHFLKENGISKLWIRQIPVIYHKCLAQEIDYALFQAGAKIIRRDSLSVYDRQNPIAFTKSRNEAIRRGEKNGLQIVEEAEFKLFWDEILLPNLDKKHGVKPVHTAEEMQNLYKSFPENIRHFNVYHKEKLVAGTTIFITDTVARPQYVSGQEDKNALGSLDYLYAYLIREVFKEKRYFDLGPSYGSNRKDINEGVLFWKESFGARIIVQDFYEVMLEDNF